MGKGWIKWAGGILLGAFANCLADHVVSCAFERVGLTCPRGSAA